MSTIKGTTFNIFGAFQISYNYTIAEENRRYGITLAVSVVDTRNFVILPEPKYSSNAGFEPALKLRDYNFLGTLMPLKIDFGYSLDDFHLGDSSKGKYALSASNEYNTYFNEWNNSVSVLGIAHKQFTGFFAASARFRYKTWFNDTEHYHDRDRAEAGNMLRGILDRSINADQMLSFNFDFPFSVFKFMPSAWAHKESLRYFDFEFHISPVIDMAFVKGTRLDSDGAPLKELKFNFDDFLVTGGIEVLVFPFAWRSIFLRGSIAWNLRETFRTGKLPSGINREIYIGLGHHF
ncbi:hypothetical protein FACS189483_11510 [Spirochaetia bacterium]|nr:hypothetical protein FACS189483_11510 [Spirochaetia bacterium]